MQNWRRPSMDEMPGPTMPFEKALALNQTRNNTQLAFGVGALVGVLWWTQLHDLLPVFSKRYDKVIKSLQPYRGQFDNFISEEQPLLATTPSLSVQYVNHEVKKEEHIEDQQLNEVKKPQKVESPKTSKKNPCDVMRNSTKGEKTSFSTKKYAKNSINVILHT